MEGLGKDRNFRRNGRRDRYDPYRARMGRRLQPLLKRDVEADSSFFQQSGSLPQTDVAEPWTLIGGKVV